MEYWSVGVLEYWSDGVLDRKRRNSSDEKDEEQVP
jgi:hypothetical protein